MDPSLIGILASLIFSILVTLIPLLIYLYARSRSTPLTFPRLFYPPLDFRPPKLPNLTLLNAFSLPFHPYLPSLHSNLILSDEELLIQTQWVILVCLLVLSVPGLVTMLPLFIIGVPSLSSSSEGGYTDLDQLTIIRLLAIDDSQPLPFSSQNRFIIIIIIYVITLLTMILIIKREMELVLEHRLKFLSHTTNRISVVYLKATEGLKNLNVKELTNLFIVSGLTSSTLDSSQTINVKRVFPLPDLVELKSLHGKRLKVLNSLEECQIEYIASFELSTGINEPVSQSRRKSTPLTPSPPVHGPLAAYTLSSSNSLSRNQRHNGNPFTSRARKISQSLQEVINQKFQGSFTEIFNTNSKVDETLYNLPVGSRVNVDESGRLVSARSSELFHLGAERRQVPSTILERESEGNRQSTSTHRALSPHSPTASGSQHLTSLNSPIQSSFTRVQPGETSTVGAVEDEALEMRSLTAMENLDRPLTPTYTRTDLTLEYCTQARLVVPTPDGPEDGSPEPTTALLASDPHIQSESTPRLEHRPESNFSKVSVPTETFQPALRPSSQLKSKKIKNLYENVRFFRSELRRLNNEIFSLQSVTLTGPSQGWIIMGQGVERLPNVQVIEGFTRNDVIWNRIGEKRLGKWGYWIGIFALTLAFCVLCVPLAAAVVTSLGGTTDFLHFLAKVKNQGGIPLGIFMGLLPALVYMIGFSIIVLLIKKLSSYSSCVSITTNSRRGIYGVAVVTVIGGIAFFIAIASTVGSAEAIDHNHAIAGTLANSAVSASSLFLNLGIVIALFIPMTILVDIPRLWRFRRSKFKTPRQYLAAIQPSNVSREVLQSYVFILFLSATVFAPVAPLVTVPALILSFSSIIITRIKAYYIWCRARQTGGLTELDTLSILLFLISISPLLLALVLLSSSRWPEAGTLLGVAIIFLAITTAYGSRTMTLATGLQPLNEVSHKALQAFAEASGDHGKAEQLARERKFSSSNSFRRKSWASILEVVSVIGPGPHLNVPGAVTSTEEGYPIPVPDEMIDPLSSGELAARTHPDAKPHLPSLVMDPETEDGLAYGFTHPLLGYRAPVVILADDPVSQEEAEDSEQFWNIQTTWRDSVTLARLGLNRPSRNLSDR